MKFIRYVLFFSFLLGLGLLALGYAAPDNFLLTARAAESPKSECGMARCQLPTTTAADGIVPQIQESRVGESHRAENTGASSTAQLVLDTEPTVEESIVQEAVESLDSLEDELQAPGQRQAVAPAGQPSTFEQVLRGVQAMQALEDVRHLQDRLRIEANLSAFTQEVSTGHNGIVRGVFVPDTLSMPIRRQPASSPGFISSEEGVATQFGMAETYGSIGLLAHNYLAGSEFFGLEEGQQVYLVYGDEVVRKFEISEIHRYRAGQPNSPYSDFYDLDNGGEKYSAKEIFHLMYNREGAVVFQTCIAEDGISTWGRLFIIATPI